MKEEQFDFVSNDFVDGIPSPDVEPEYEYLEIALTKEQMTKVFVKVPKGFDKKTLTRKHIEEFLEEQDPEWEDESYYSFHVTQKVDEKYATEFGYSEI